MNCRWDGRCDGVDCYYDHIRAEREAQPGYDEKKWYMVDVCRKCAYTKAYSQREVDEYWDKNPEDDMDTFMTAEEIAADNEIKWETDEIWYQRGQEDARSIADEKGLEEVYGWWKDYDRNELKAKSDFGFFDELMKMAREAGLKKD